MSFQKSWSVTCDLNPLAGGSGNGAAHLGAEDFGIISKDTRERDKFWKHTGEAYTGEADLAVGIGLWMLSPRMVVRTGWAR